MSKSREALTDHTTTQGLRSRVLGLLCILNPLLGGSARALGVER